MSFTIYHLHGLPSEEEACTKGDDFFSNGFSVSCLFGGFDTSWFLG
jgi:hypothetical protein